MLVGGVDYYGKSFLFPTNYLLAEAVAWQKVGGPKIGPGFQAYLERFTLPSSVVDWERARKDPAFQAALPAEQAVQGDLLRDVWGNPFGSVHSLSHALFGWNDATIPRLAQAAHEHLRLPSGHLDPARLAILADALEEAGCTNPDILAHLRGPGPHVLGCWVVDALLGKT
jgi:hypothetical protein